MASIFDFLQPSAASQQPAQQATLFDLLRRSAMAQQATNGGAGIDPQQAQYAPQQAPQAAPQQIVGANQPSPLDTAQWPAGPVGAPSQAMAMMPQQAARPVAQPQVSTPGLGDHLAAGAQSFAGSGGRLIPSILNGFAGLVSGQRQDPAFKAGNQTAKALIAKGVEPDIAAAAMNSPELMKALIAQHFGTKQVQNLGDGYIYKDGQVVQAYDKSKADGATEYGLNPIYGKDEQGNDVLGTLGKNGTFKKIDTGGVKLNSGVDKIDLGTHYQLRDRKTGQIIATEKKDIAGAKREGEIGESQGKAIAAAPADIQSGQNALDMLDKIEKHPYIDRGTGATSVANRIPGTGGYDFENLVEQAKSGAFLQAIQQMRGLGSLSNSEGGAATAAITRMNTATSKEAFLDAANDYRKVVKQGMSRAQSRLANPSAINPGAAAPNVDDLLKKYGGS